MSTVKCAIVSLTPEDERELARRIAVVRSFGATEKSLFDPRCLFGKDLLCLEPTPLYDLEKETPPRSYHHVSVDLAMRRWVRAVKLDQFRRVFGSQHQLQREHMAILGLLDVFDEDSIMVNNPLPQPSACPFKDQLMDYLYDLDLPVSTPESERSEGSSTIPDEMRNGYGSDNDSRSTSMSVEVEKEEEAAEKESDKEEGGERGQRPRRYSDSVYVRCHAVYGKVLTKQQADKSASCPPSQSPSTADPTSAKGIDSSATTSLALPASTPNVPSRLNSAKPAKQESTLGSKQHEALQSTTPSCTCITSSTPSSSPSALSRECGTTKKENRSRLPTPRPPSASSRPSERQKDGEERL